MPDIKNNIKVIYNALSKEGYNDLGSEQEFAESMADENNRKLVYNTLKGKEFADVKDYDSFSNMVYQQPRAGQQQEEEMKPVEPAKIDPRFVAPNVGKPTDAQPIMKSVQQDTGFTAPQDYNSQNAFLSNVDKDYNVASHIPDAQQPIKMYGADSNLGEVIDNLYTVYDEAYKKDNPKKIAEAANMARSMGLDNEQAEKALTLVHGLYSQNVANNIADYMYSRMNNGDPLYALKEVYYNKDFQKKLKDTTTRLGLDNTQGFVEYYLKPALQRKLENERGFTDTVNFGVQSGSDDVAKNTEVFEKRKAEEDLLQKQVDAMNAEGKRIEEKGQQMYDPNYKNRPWWADLIPVEGGGRSAYDEAEGIKRNPEAEELMRTGQAMQRMSDDAQAAISEDNILRTRKTDGLTNQIKNAFGRILRGGAKTATDIRTWDFGFTDLKDATVIKAAADAYASNRATAAQKALLNAVALKNAVMGKHGDALGGLYGAAGTTIQMAPYMMQFAASPVKGVGVGFQKYCRTQLEKAFGKYATEAVGKFVIKSGELAGRFVGDVAQGAAMTTIFNMPAVAADTHKRMTGDLEATTDSKGNIVYSGKRTNVKSGGRAFAEAFTAQTIENQSELVGEYFAPLQEFIQKGAIKALDKWGLSKTKDFLTGINNKQIMKGFNRFTKKTEWNKLLGETGEEFIGNIENAATVGDLNFKLDPDDDNSIFSKKVNTDIILGVGLGCGIISGARVGSYIRNNRKLNTAINDADTHADVIFGTDRWQQIKSEIDNAPDDKAGSLLQSYINNAKLNNEQKQTIVDYTVNTYIKRGNDISHLKNAIEDNISSEQQEVQSAYENGQNARDSQMNEVKTSLDEAEKHAAEVLGEDELNALDGVEDVDAFKESNAYKSYSEEQREAALKYIIARTAYNGMINRVQDEIKAAVNKTNAEIDNLTHKDSGTIIRATLKNGDQEVYVVSGNVATSPDGKSIDTEKSDSDIVVYNTENGKKEMLNIKDLQSVDTPIDAATYKADSAAETTQQIAEAEAAKIDGTRSFHYNDTVKVQDKEGNLIDGSVQDVTPDGIIVVSDAYPGGKTYTAAELTAMQPQPQTVAENATVEQQAEEAVADNESNEAPAEEKGEANSPQSEATPQEETAEPQQQAVEPQQQAIPTDDKGSLLYHEVPVERTIEDLYDGSLDDTEITDFISANIEAAQKEYNSVVKKAPKIGTDKARYLQEKKAYQEEVDKAKAKVDYWQAVENERQRITHTSPEELKNAEDELSGEAARKDYRGITAGDEENPTSVEDLVRDFLRGAKITPEDFRKETGLSISEQKKFVGMISKQGKTIARLGEELADYDAMNLGGRFFDGDSNAARGAIIDALLSSRTRGDFKEQDATAEEERYIEAVEQQREQWYYENYHMTYEEYLQYREIVLPELLRKYANFAPDILYPQFVASFEDAYVAEHSQTNNTENNEQQRNDTTAEEPTTTPGDTVLQTEETNNSRGDSQSEEQPTEVPTGVRSSNENGTLPQSTPTEVDKEPLSEEAAQSLITSMEENAIEDPEIRLTPQTWLETFGINNSIDTPIGKVRMGENQYAKLQDKKRTSEFCMISLTLSDPDVIFVEPSKAKGEDVAERNFSYVFAKTFKRNGNKVKYYTSVTVSIDGLEISVSSHFVNPNKMLNKLMEFNREYTKETLFSNSSEMRLAEHQSDVPDLLPTQENNVSSDSKVTQSSQTKQEKENKFSPTPRKDGESITDYAERVAEEHKAQRTRKEEEAKVDTNPTDAQKEAGNYKKGHVKVDGLNITIEQPKGSIRRGADANGKQWESEMHNTYGYIRGTESVDGDHIDIFLSDNPTEGNVFVVDQINKDGSFDEHKVMYGFPDMESARQAYLSNYEEGWQGLGSITEVKKEDFKKWIDSSKRKTKPFAEYTSVKTQDDTQTKNPTEENAAPTNTQTKENNAHNSNEIMHEQKNVQLQQAINAHENATKFYYQQLKEGKLDKVFESKQWKDVLRKQTELQKALLQFNSEELKELLKQTTNEDTKKEIKGALDAVLRQEQRSIEYNAVLDKQEPITPIYKEEKNPIAVTEFVETDKKEAEIHPVLTGVYHDNGYVVGTNAHILLARKEDYNKSLEGKITNKKGEVIDGKYPNWRAVVEGETTTNSWGINLDELHAFVRGVLAKLKADGANKSTIDSATIAFKDNDGKIIVCNAKTLDKALRGAKSIGATEFGNKSETFAHAQTKKGYVVCPTISTYHSINDNCFVYAPKEAARQQTTATLTNDTEAKQKATEAVLAALSKAGIEVVRATDEQAQELLANTHATSLRTPQGTIYGWSVNGKIYLTEAGINPDTPIHEYTHLWAEAMMIKNKKGWDSIKALLKDNPIWNEVVADANYSNIADNEDAVASEVLSRISGKKNAAKMEEEAQRAIDEAKGVFEKARATTILTNLKKALNSLWKWVSKNIFDVKEFSSINEVTDKVLYDLIHGTKLINDKSLIGVHNISEQKLRKVLKQGGFANPSIAVIDTDKQVHNDYGEISLILPSRKVNKSTGKNVGTYEGDAWTPMYPIIEKQMSNDGNLIMHNDINSVPNEMQSEVRNALNRWLDNGSDTDLSYLYLFQQGKAPKMATVKPKYSNEVYKSLRDIMFGVDSVYNLTKGEVKKLVELYVQTELNGDIDEYNKANERRITKYKETIESGRTNSMYYKIAERNLEEVKKYGYPLSSLKTFADDVQRDKTKQGSKNVQKTLNAASQIIKDAGLEEDFRNWVEGLNNRYQTKEVIFDGFTPTGKRRYIPNTLENVSKLMKKQGRQASTGLGVSFSNFAASVMKANGSLANIRKKKSKLTNEHKDIENFEEKWKEVYFDLAMKLQPNASTFDDYGFTRLQEAALEADPQAFLSKEYGVTLSKEDVRKLQQMVKAIQEERPAMYFETKFERPVTLNEFSKAVVPEDLSDDLQKTLRDNGIEIFTYKRGDAEDRQKATQEAAYSSDDIAFQIISNGNNEANNDSDTRFQIVGNSLSDEEKKIVETAKANDTYMKAPNGKPTNLSEKQWTQVRTTAFKNWFGDWEKAARIEKVRRSKAVVISGSEYKDKYELNRDSAKEWIKDNLRGEYTIADTEEIVSLTKVGANKVTSHGMSNKAHLQSIAAIPQLIRNAIFIEERPNEKHNNKYDSYKYYICGLKIGTTDYTVKLTIGVKSGKKYYDHALTEIEKGKLLDRINDQADEKGFTTTGDAPLQSYALSIGKDSKLLSILQTNSSKVVDENGEPMVVYHGTLADGLRQFSTDFIGSRYSYDEKGFFFISNRKIADDYAVSEFDASRRGEVIDAYVSLGNPLVVNSEWCRKNGLGSNVFKDNDVIEFWDNYQSLIVEESEQNDGVIVTDGETSMVVAFFPNQIKSATDNNGNFSTTEDDILYRTVFGGNSGYVGYSMSKRAAEAKEEGRYPKTEFKREYHITEKSLDMLTRLGFIDNSEWHHTSMYGNKTPFYGWAEDELADDYLKHKKEIDTLCKGIDPKTKQPLIEKVEKPQYEYKFELPQYNEAATAANPIREWRHKQIEKYDQFTGFKGYADATEEEKKERDAYLHSLNEQMEEKIREMLAKDYPDYLAAKNALDAYNNYEEDLRKAIGEHIKEYLDIDKYSQRWREQTATTQPTTNTEELTNHAESVVQNLHLNNVEIVPDGSSLNGEQATAKGFYNKRTGKIVVVASNHTDIADIEKTVLHEAVAHHGLRELFGDNFDNFLDTVFAKADIETRQQIAHLSAKHGWNIRTATEEYLASMAEDTNFEQIKPTLWQRIKQLFGEIMSAFGLHHANITDNDLRYILWRSYKNLQNSGKHSILDKAEDIAMQYRLKVGNYTDKFTDELNAVNERFNEKLSNLTEENADKVALNLGTPSAILRAAGVENKPMKLYGNKVIKKIKKHGFALEELKDLPKAVANPIAVFNNYKKEGNRSILTELKTKQGNFLVTIDLGKGTEDIDFNIVSSVFGKDSGNIVDWIERGLAVYINKEKALNYLHHSALRAEALSSSRLNSAAKIIKDFHNPKLNSNVLYRSSIDPTATEVLPDARTRYEEETKEPDNIDSVPKTHNFFRRFYKSYVDSMLALKSFTNSVLEATGDKMASHEDTYKAENAMTSKNKTDGEVYNRDYYNPLLTAAQQLCEAVGMDYDALNMYMVAKHGLERNEYMGKRAAQNDENVLKAKKALEDALVAYNEDPTSKNEAAVQKAQEKYTKVYDKALEVHTSRDYSGLTELTDKEDVAEAEYEAQKIVDAVETPDAMPKVTAFWSKVNAATKQTLKTGYESGIMTKDTYEHILNMYKYYIPLRGWAKPTADDVYTYYNNRSYEGKPLTKTAKGRTSLAEDPMAIIASMAQHSIIEANRNKMKQTFLNFVLNHPTSLATVGEQWYIKNALGEWERSDANIPANATPDEISKLVAEHELEMQRLAEQGTAIKQRNGLKLDKRVINGEGEEHTIKVWRGGKEYIIYINGNPAVAQAVNGLTNPDTQGSKLPKWAEIGAAQLKNFLSGVYTSFSPAFVLTNFTRDQLFASQAVYIKYGLKYKRQASKNARNLFFSGALPRLVYKWEHGTLNMNDETERYFDEFMRGGGETGFTALRDIESIKKEIKDAINGNKVNIAKRGWKSFINAVEFANRSAEDFSRFVTFMTSRQQGKNIVDSIYDAKDITVNFNKKGSGEMGSRFMNFAYIFFNAAVQSINNFGTMLKQHPARTMLVISKFGALGFGVPMLNAFLAGLYGGGDDDKYWDNMDWVRRNNIVLRIPFLEKTFISIPLPQELRPFYGMGEIAVSILFGKETFSSGLQKAVEGFTGLLPIDFTGNGGNLSITLTPTVLQPVAQYMFNTDYFGRKVYNDNEKKKFAPGWTKAFSSTPPALIGATKFLNSLTGGNDVDKGAVSLNPDVINHFVKGYFGGPATFVTQMSSLLYKGFSGDAKEIRWRDIPVASRFVQQLDERSVRSSAQGSYKDFKEETEETEYRLSNYKKQVKMGKMEYAKMITDLIKSPEYQRYKIAKAYKKPMDLLKEALNHIDNTTDKKEVEKALTGLRHYMMETVESEQKGKHAKREEDFNYLGDNLSELNNNLKSSLRSLKRNEEQRLDGEEDDGIEELISEDKETTMRIIREMNKLFKKK
ncbi:LPD38 domain-containing protein [Prevotella pallens]|uniref:ADP-ribosyltransferase-containing protein n=1 Tax=Prevotella pallens TaxID=60133 RepID=UPI001CB015C5|nr:LPD38 domain-containing protein [Prevotella pallens]MBF1475696.1 hypothetical protein [Prevotella pallens]